MADRITIPAACLEALGGLHEDDPPVLVLSGQGTCRGVMPVHPLNDADRGTPFHADERILVRQSAPALLAVLERDGAEVHSAVADRMDRLAALFIREAIAAHGSDPGWSVEVNRG